MFYSVCLVDHAHYERDQGGGHHSNLMVYFKLYYFPNAFTVTFNDINLFSFSPFNWKVYISYKYLYDCVHSLIYDQG